MADDPTTIFSSGTLRCDPPHANLPQPAVHVVGWRRQRTLAAPIRLQARGLVYGNIVNLSLSPAPANTGRIFRRLDLPNSAPIPALAEHVFSTARRTVLGQPPNQVELVEHVLAALVALMVDNCILDVDAQEMPGWDGSVQPLTEALLATGTVEQDALIPIVTPQQTLVVRHKHASMVLHPLPQPELHVHYFLDYGGLAAIPPQRFGCRITPENFLNHLAASRTFLLLEEVEALRRQGIGVDTGPEQVLVFGRHGVLGNRLRWADEPARHKTLDLIGDLALVGLPLAGRVVACRSGHTLNISLANHLRIAILSSGIKITRETLPHISAA